MTGFLPNLDRQYLNDKKIPFKEVIDGGRKGLVLLNHQLPYEKFDTSVADILILLPKGYPDVPPDMFHTMPWVKLKSNNQYPDRADHAVSFDEKNWQRWSRHSNEWRPGVDGIRTFIKRIDNALVVTK